MLVQRKMILGPLLLLLCGSGLVRANPRPNIIFIVADDLGWNDVGFHGSSQIPTPNIDALAYSGVILNNYYVTPICTPSRSALMTGKYPIHTGMQHGVLYGAEPRGLPLQQKLLPEYLRELGYSNHAVGKWHLGFYRKEYTPLYRGFDSHLGFWTGHHDYNDHTAMETGFWGLDARRGMDPAWDLHGKYSTEVFTDEAVRLIRNHNTTRPLFLYIAHAAVHSANSYNPLPVSDKLAAGFTKITDYNRQRFAGMLTKLDDSVGAVVRELSRNKMLENSIIVFTTDNGGPAAGFNLNAASNWPLRGVKNTLWEGGLRGPGVIWSPYIKRPSRVSYDLMHITDWLPTLLSAVRGNPSDAKDIDGIDLWTTISKNVPSNRTEILHNIDDIIGNAALTVGEWKLVKGTSYKGAWDGWFGPSGRDAIYEYDPNVVISSPTGQAIVASTGKPITKDQINGMRSQAEIFCDTTPETSVCHPLEASCLFNIKRDPCENNNLAKSFPEILDLLEGRLSALNKTAVPPGNRPIDQRGNPNNWDHTWTNFGDSLSTKNMISETVNKTSF